HRSGRPDLIALLGVCGEHLVRAEAPEVDRLRGIMEILCRARRQDLLPRAVALRPERRPPGRVQRLEGAVLRAQPDAERPRGVRAVVERAVLVVDVPAAEAGVAAEALRERPRDAAACRTIGGRADRVRVPG